MHIRIRVMLPVGSSKKFNSARSSLCIALLFMFAVHLLGPVKYCAIWSTVIKVSHESAAGRACFSRKKEHSTYHNFCCR